jgi:hypothetical protein
MDVEHARPGSGLTGARATRDQAAATSTPVRSAERRILRLGVDNDHRWTVGRNGEFELIPDLFSRLGLYRAQPETLGDRHDVESWKVEARNAGRLLQLANDLRIEYSPLRKTTNTIGSLCWAAVQTACTEYWNEPSPMVAMTVRCTPRARSPRATPTAPGTPQPIPPLAVVKNEPVRTVGSHSACWTMVEVDSLTITASDGRTSLSAA